MGASLTWMGHGTVRLVFSDERVVWIDPWLANNPACPKAMKQPSRCDMIVLTHGHFDHASEVPALIETFKPIVIANPELCSTMERLSKGGTFRPMNTGGTQTVDGVRVSLTHALHSSSVDTADGPRYTGMPNGVVISAEGLAPIYHAGDTDVFSDMKLIAKLLAPKVAILPIGDRYTMGARGAALAAEFLNPEVIVPVHYGSFPVLDQTPDAFCAALSESLKGRVLTPDIGTPLPWTADGLG